MEKVTYKSFYTLNFLVNVAILEQQENCQQLYNNIPPTQRSSAPHNNSSLKMLTFHQLVINSSS